MADSFSIDKKLIKPSLSKYNSELKDLNDRLENIYDKVVINGIPIVRQVMAFANPSPEECNQLSKVWRRIAEIQVKRNDLNTKVTLLRGMEENTDWLFEEVGDHTRDFQHGLDGWLNSILDNGSNENDDFSTSRTDESD